MGAALDQSQVEKRIEAECPEWFYDTEKKQLYTGIEFTDFDQAIEFVNAVAEVAAEQNHHPDILVHDYKLVQLMVSTHDALGVTDKDFDFAKAIDALLSQSE